MIWHCVNLAGLAVVMQIDTRMGHGIIFLCVARATRYNLRTIQRGTQVMPGPLIPAILL